MQAIEFQTKVQNGTIEIPDRYKLQIEENESVRVICLVEEPRFVSSQISQEEELLEALTAIAKELNLSENKLLAVALNAYLRRYRAKKFVQSWTDAYEDGLDEGEEAMLAAMLRQQRHFRENE